MYVRHRFDAATEVAADGREAFADQVARTAEMVNSLDLTVIVRRLMTSDDGPKWSEDKARAAERNYRRFLQMALLYPGRALAPTREIDAVWHEHILNTRAYWRDCEALFGRYLHHDAGFGSEEKDVVAKSAYDDETAAIYQALYGEDYFSAAATTHCTLPTCIVDAAAEGRSRATAPHCTLPTCIVDGGRDAAAVAQASARVHCTLPTCIVDAAGAATFDAARSRATKHCTLPTCIVDAGRGTPAAAQASARVHCTLPTCIVDAGRETPAAAQASARVHCTLPTCIVDAGLETSAAARTSPRVHCTLPTCIVDAASDLPAAARAAASRVHCTLPTCIVEVNGAVMLRSADTAAHCTLPTCIVDAAEEDAPGAGVRSRTHCTLPTCIVDARC